MVLSAESGVLINERLADPRGVLLIDAEDDRLLKAVAALLEDPPSRLHRPCRAPGRPRGRSGRPSPPRAAAACRRRRRAAALFLSCRLQPLGGRRREREVKGRISRPIRGSIC